jgi:uncharacterized surface protein with fasciclin (FAS1) repeats
LRQVGAIGRLLGESGREIKYFPKNRSELGFETIDRSMPLKLFAAFVSRITFQNRNTMKFRNLLALVGVFIASHSLALADHHGKKDIVDTAVAAGSFKTLAAALGAADLVGALKGDGPFTVFAPTDEAFAKLPAGTVEMLLKPENKAKLVDILTYHVVAANVPAATAVTLTEATALNKKKIKLGLRGDALYLNDSKVIKTDIMCTNGVIHVIDTVLMPPAKAY